jgi:hypothetical protein
MGNLNAILTQLCIFYLYIVIVSAGNLVTFGNEHGTYQPIPNGGAGQQIFIRASKIGITSIQIGNVIYGTTGTESTGNILCWGDIPIPDNGYIPLLMIQSSSSTHASISSAGSLTYISIMLGTPLQEYSCGTLDPLTTVQWSMDSSKGYNTILAGVYFDDNYIYGLQFEIIQNITFKLGGSKAELSYTGDINMIQPGDVLSFYWMQGDVYYLSGMQIMRNGTAIGYGNAGSRQLMMEFQIHNSSMNFNLRRIESTNLYNVGTQAITYMEGDIDGISFTMGKSISRSAVLSMIDTPITLVGIYVSNGNYTSTILIDALAFSIYPIAGISEGYSLQCAADLAIFNINSALIEAQGNWTQANQACIAAGAQLPTTPPNTYPRGTYALNCDNKVNALKIACFNTNGSFCTYIGIAYVNANYGMVSYSLNLWNRGCVPSTCLDLEYDRQQIGQDIMNATYNVFPQCSNSTCTYTYSYEIQCENSFPGQDTSNIPSWAITLIATGSAFIALLIAGAIIVAKRRRRLYNSVK